MLMTASDTRSAGSEATAADAAAHDPGCGTAT
jgi:hypothetical protein